MSEYGEGWREDEGGDVRVPSDVEDSVEIEAAKPDYDAMADAALSLIGEDTPSQEEATSALSAAQMETMARKYGSDYFELRKHLEESILFSTKQGGSPKIKIEGEGGKTYWISTGNFEASDLYTIRKNGGLTNEGFALLQQLLRSSTSDDQAGYYTDSRGNRYKDAISRAAGDSIDD
ncbi:TPA: hypothetical protein DD425_03140 [Candidatus Saccharibacteria bacterium]|nr:hypothetical protein [Candidatus Saccharibacteria bacterium]|tara:strand:+ start:191 stop:721 length:531 start_codon:yes stop_codon:yes gene_type:complete